MFMVPNLTTLIHDFKGLDLQFKIKDDRIQAREMYLRAFWLVKLL